MEKPTSLIKAIDTDVRLTSGFIFLVGIIFCIVFNCCKKTPESSIEKIETLENKIQVVEITKDSIQKEIDTVYIQIDDTKIQYEKDVARIINNDANEDYSFFINYINGFDSCICK